MPRLPADDAGLWHQAVRDVAPLAGRTAPREPQPDRGRLARCAAGTEAVQTAPPAAPPRAPQRPPEPMPPLDHFAGVDRASTERLKRGRYPVEATLDLHGLTQEEAHRALSRFVAGGRAAGRRCVLVVTGHGRMSGGVLKAAVPRWLDEPGLRPHLLAVSRAQPKDGGDAALYLLLRRSSR